MQAALCKGAPRRFVRDAAIRAVHSPPPGTASCHRRRRRHRPVACDHCSLVDGFRNESCRVEPPLSFLSPPNSITPPSREIAMPRICALLFICAVGTLGCPTNPSPDVQDAGEGEGEGEGEPDALGCPPPDLPPCIDQSDCESGTCGPTCRSDSSSCRPLACTVDSDCPGGACHICTGSGERTQSAFCSDPIPIDGLCLRASDSGVCRRSTAGCEAGLECAITFNDGISVFGHCTPPAQAGSQCVPPASQEFDGCDAGLTCDATTATCQ
jgi:hypothetical protein